MIKKIKLKCKNISFYLILLFISNYISQKTNEQILSQSQKLILHGSDIH